MKLKLPLFSHKTDQHRISPASYPAISHYSNYPVKEGGHPTDMCNTLWDRGMGQGEAVILGPCTFKTLNSAKSGIRPWRSAKGWNVEAKLLLCKVSRTKQNIFNKAHGWLIIFHLNLFKISRCGLRELSAAHGVFSFCVPKAQTLVGQSNAIYTVHRVSSKVARAPIGMSEKFIS